jgi:imidazolonepropionase-like amidohydrolase
VTLRVTAERLFDGESLHEGPVSVDFAGGVITAVHFGDAPDVEGLAARHHAPVAMPGLVNAHVHITRLGAFQAQEPISLGGIADTVERTLRSGITTAADMGSTLGLVGALRDFTTDRPGAGPRIRAAGPIVTAPDGYPFDWIPPLFAWMGVARPCADERAARKTVGELARGGADHVKVAIMHEGYDGQPLRALDAKTAAAVVAEAHALGMRVHAHAHSEVDYIVALEAGVDSLVHSSFTPLAPDTVRRIADAGVSVCPTLWVFESVCLGAEEGWHRDPVRTADLHPHLVRSWRWFAEAYAASGDVMPEGMVGAGLAKARVVEAVRVAAANLKLLRDHGVPIAFGNDASYGYSLVYRPDEELAAMERAGMPALDVLRAATSGAADLLGLEDCGRIAVGKRADLLLVDDATTSLRVRDAFVGGIRARSDRTRGTLAAARGIARSVVLGLGNLGRRT